MLNKKTIKFYAAAEDLYGQISDLCEVNEAIRTEVA